MLAQTKQGMVKGVKDGSIYVFKGIPYAEPPVGSLRFRPPVPPGIRQGILDALQFGDMALQPRELIESADCLPLSENCLNLNIWTSAPDNRKRKVLFWIHGGGFIGGSSACPGTYGKTFAEKDDIVFVSINYRLGVFGFLHLGDLLGEEYASSGNCGLLDMIAALRWVRENIGNFGGDPDGITIMGHSAGAKSVAALLMSPQARGLFHGAILHSGSIQSIRDKETANAVAEDFLSALNLEKSEAYKLLELDADKIVQAEAVLFKSVRSCYIFGPVIDGVTIPYPPEQLIDKGNLNAVPVLLGTTREEISNFGFANPSQDESIGDIISTLFGKNGPVVLTAFEKACKEMKEDAALKYILTEYLYRIAARRLGALLSNKGIPVWMYQFDYHGSTAPVHGAEMPFVWLDTENMQTNEKELSIKMHAAWISFIKTGAPQNSLLPTWHPYKASEGKGMIFDNVIQFDHLTGIRDDSDFVTQMIRL